MLEEHRFSADGRLETTGVGRYHIPSVSSLPLQMNVTLLKGSGNTMAVYSSRVFLHFVTMRFSSFYRYLSPHLLVFSFENRPAAFPGVKGN